MRLAEPDAGEWVASAPWEERIVCYADKRATQRMVSLDKRFARWQRKHPEYADTLAEALDMARRLEGSLCQATGIDPDEVERLRWVEDALARAEANGHLAAVANRRPAAPA
jgi:hypothetical protein